MSGEEVLHELERQRYYREQAIKSTELNKLFWTVAVPIIVIVSSLLSIAGNVRELLEAL